MSVEQCSGFAITDLEVYGAYGTAIGNPRPSGGTQSTHRDPVGFGAQYGYYTDWDLAASSTSLSNVPILLGATQP